MIIVTSGEIYSDIDVLACSVSYSELLIKNGDVSCAVLPGIFNKSITNSIRKWKFNYLKKPPDGNADYVIVDMSNPKFFAGFVDETRIRKIFDHHPGFEKYWKEKLGKNAVIEKIGACATLIWEEYKKSNSDKTISPVSANLLYTAIASNTLNFKAKITTIRDKESFEELGKHTDLPDKWIENYFEEQDIFTDKNPGESILYDIRRDTINSAQVEMWDSSGFINKNRGMIDELMQNLNNPKWFLTSPCISEGKNYIYCKNPEVRSVLEKSIGVKFEGDIGTTDRLWLRKEIWVEINLKI